MKRFQIAAFGLLCVVAVHAPAVAQTSYPMLMSLKPTAAQVGKSSVHTVSSRYSMAGAYQVLVSGTGVTGEVVTKSAKGKAAKSGTRLQIRFSVSTDAMPGVRDFRLGTPNGASTLGQLVIVRDPVTVEKGANNTPPQALAVKLPATICGAIERNEDVDYFKFNAKAGQSITFHMRAMRLQDRIHDLQRHVDPIISLKNRSGSTLAQSDNHYAADPLLTHRFEQDGEYYLEIRDVRYHGNTYWEYSVEAAERPYLAGVHPMGVAKGKSTPLEILGRQLPQNRQSSVTVPGKSPLGPQTVRLKLPNGEFSNPVTVIVSDLAQGVETAGENSTPKTAQAVKVPGGISGRIEQEADIDCFVFDAKKGERFTFEVMAGRFGSRLDSHLRILDAESGRQYSLNDDMRSNRRSFSDSRIETWTAPADGKFVIEIRDLDLSGGDDYFYYINCTRADATFALYLDTDKTLLTPGTSGVIFARAFRKNGFDGEIALHVDGLPKGVTATCGKILAGKATDGCIILTAAPNAKMAVANVTVTGHATTKTGGKSKDIRIKAQPQQETYMPGGGRNHWHVGMCTVSVGAPNDLRAVKLSTYDVTLKPGESKRIEVSLERAPGFRKNVTLDVRFRHLSSMFANSLPSGVTIDGRQSKTLLTGKISKGYITLKASPTAKPAEKQQVSVMANISINFVMKATYSSKPLLVTIKKP